MPIIVSLHLPMRFPISIAINKPQVMPTIMFSHHWAWNTCPMTLVLFYLHGKSTNIVTNPSPLGEHHPRCSMMLMTSEKFYLWSFITQLVVVFTMKEMLKRKRTWQLPHSGDWVVSLYRRFFPSIRLTCPIWGRIGAGGLEDLIYIKINLFLVKWSPRSVFYIMK